MTDAAGDRRAAAGPRQQRGDGRRHVVSRLSGFVRSALLAAALGAALHADIFNIANTIPNMLYILLAGGIFNAVLVPQLVRAMRDDPDGGDAYTNRIITLAALFLAAVTVLLVVAAPWVMQLFLDSDYNEPDLAAQRDSVITFARYCLPQVFFYGMFVLVGQILNARGRFGPMMWAPIANNVISVAVLVVYLVVFGPARRRGVRRLHARPGAAARPRRRPLGIVAQFLILLPYLRARRLPLPARASTSAAPGWATPCGWASGPCCSSSSTRSPTPSSSGWPPAARRARRRRHRLHGLLLDVPDHDGAALDRHRLAGDRDPAPALGPRRRATT